MKEHVDSLDFWSLMLRVLGVLQTIASFIIALVIRTQNEEAIGMAFAVLVGGIAATCPLFALSAICRALVPLLDGQEEVNDEREAERDHRLQIEQELSAHAAAELERLQGTVPVVSKPQRDKTAAEREAEMAEEIRRLHRERRH